MDELTRDEFEKWLETDEGVSRFGMELTDAYRHFAWQGWQAGAAAERERLNAKIAALERDVDHFFKLSGQYLERANKAEEQLR